MPQQLPIIPNVEHLRKQAKDDFLRACRAGDDNALSNVRVSLPRFCQLSPDTIINSIRLKDALTFTARFLYGFLKTWGQNSTNMRLRLIRRPHLCRPRWRILD